jgi:hypothetical protein
VHVVRIVAGRRIRHFQSIVDAIAITCTGRGALGVLAPTLVAQRHVDDLRLALIVDEYELD